MQVLQEHEHRRPLGEPVEQLQRLGAAPPPQRLRVGRPDGVAPLLADGEPEPGGDRLRGAVRGLVRAEQLRPSPPASAGGPCPGRRSPGCRAARRTRCAAARSARSRWTARPARAAPRPRSAAAPASVSTSCTSRDLPTPASPTTVTIRRARSLTTAAKASWSCRSWLLAADRAGDHALDAAGLGPVPLAVDGDHDEGVDRPVDALQLQAPDPAQPELPAHLPGRVGGQQDGAGAGRRLQPGGAVGGLADDEELPGRPLGQARSRPSRRCRCRPASAGAPRAPPRPAR